MGKLHDLLYAIIDRVNKSVKTTAQALSEGEKTQARTNIGAMPSTYVPPNQTAQQVGADPKGTAAAAVSEHNTSPTSHEDIRSVVTGLTERLNALANSDDTTLDQMKEVVEYIKDNRELIESVTTSKVNVTDIVNNLTTNVSNKPLSAAQGVILKGLIDTLSAEALRTSDVVNNLTSSSTTKPLSAYQGNILRKMIESSSGGGGGVNLDSAEVGQLIVVEAVDADGQPIKWQAVDRTHYKETIGEDVAVLAETSVAFTNSTATVSGFVAGAIKEGLTYTVNWNGTEYTCKAYLDDGIVHLGNSALAGGSVTTSDPFCIVGTGATCMVFKNTENTETITLKVDGVAEVVYHKLPQEYLPDGVPYCIEGGMAEVLPETTVTASEDMDGLMAATSSAALTPGDYTVIWNGVAYACTTQEIADDGMTTQVLGNLGSVGLGADTGEPFAIIDYTPLFGTPTLVMADLSGATSATVAIYQSGVEIHKLDNRCLDLEWLPIIGAPQTIYSNPVLGFTNFNENNSKYSGSGFDSNVLPLVEGKTYYVTWAGVEYKSIAKTQEGFSGCYLGNLALASTVDTDTGEPFLIVAGTIPNVGDLTAFYAEVTEEEKNNGSEVFRSVKIVEEGQPNKMPEEFLPESVESVILRSSTAGSTKLFKLTVDDSGTITATEVT